MTKNDTLRKEAINLGLCEQWQHEWDRQLSDKELIMRFVRGIDFCIEHKFPALNYIRKNFKTEDLRFCGVLLDETLKSNDIGSLRVIGFFNDGSACSLPDTNILVLDGDTKGELHFGGYMVATLICKGNSNVSIKVDDNAIIRVSLYENANARITESGIHKVRLYDRRNG